MNFHKKYKKISPWWKFIRQEFELTISHVEKTPIIGYSYEDKKVKLTKTGFITLKEGFKWGASSFTIDTKSSRRGSCSHDGFFYLSDMGVFKGPESYSIMHQANDYMYSVLLEDGMYEWRAKGWYEGLEFGSESSWEKESE
jgi:hypothetical protein